jgi:hypothetical protein
MSIYERCGKRTRIECLDRPEGRCGNVNYCIGGFMSHCGAGPCLFDQQACKFFRKSSVGERCMHYCVSLDGHCDCVDAQQEMKRKSQPKR